MRTKMQKMRIDIRSVRKHRMHLNELHTKIQYNCKHWHTPGRLGSAEAGRDEFRDDALPSTKLKVWR
jgi:hypothetical protein